MILAFLAFSAALLAQTPVESLIASYDDHKGVTVIAHTSTQIENLYIVVSS